METSIQTCSRAKINNCASCLAFRGRRAVLHMTLSGQQLRKLTSYGRFMTCKYRIFSRRFAVSAPQRSTSVKFRISQQIGVFGLDNIITSQHYPVLVLSLRTISQVEFQIVDTLFVKTPKIRQTLFWIYFRHVCSLQAFL